MSTSRQVQDYKFDTDVPVPAPLQKPTGLTHYSAVPWREFKVGESILFEKVDYLRAKTLKVCQAKRGKELGMKFLMRKLTLGDPANYRIWRIA